MKINKEKIIKPPRILIYGVGGVGKTKFCSELPKPIFSDIEGGADELGVDRFDRPEHFLGFLEQIKWLLKNDHDYKTYVIDSIDWLEKLAEEDSANAFNKLSVGEVDFGKGYSRVVSEVARVLDLLDELRNKKSMIIALTGHAKIVTFEDPTSASYNRYSLDCRDKVTATVVEWVDCVAFANYRFAVKKEGESFGKDTVKAVGSGERVMYLEERPAYIAKNRYGIKEVLPLDAKIFLNKIRSNVATDSNKGDNNGK